MEEKNRNKLQDALRNLPQHEPENLPWKKLQAALDFEDRLQQLIPELPQHEPENDLWNYLEAHLEPVKQTRHFQLKDYFRFASAAAAVLVLLVASVFILRMRQPEKAKLTYSEEIVLEEPSQPLLSQHTNEGLQFIKQQCSSLPDICQKPEFKELEQELAKLEEEHQMLQKQIAVFGDDPVLIRNQIKIENLRAECTKKLIQIIIS